MGYSNKEKQREYQRQWIAKRRAEYFSDKKCVVCGSKKNLELDHINPTDKKMNPSALWSLSESNQKRIDELAKCQVLCKSHHKDKTLVDISNRLEKEILQHGTATMYDYHGCRCSPCKDAATIKRRRFKRN